MSCNVVAKNIVANNRCLACHSDPNLVNPWGLVVSNCRIWSANNVTSTVTSYTLSGKLKNTITLPTGTKPTALIKNKCGGFPVSNGLLPPTTGNSQFLVATQTGKIIGIFPTRCGPYMFGTAVDNSSINASYTGLAAVNGLLYATDFQNNVVNVFNSTFQPVLGFSFVDNTIPAGYAVFNIVNIGFYLYVTYAQQSSVPGVPTNGAGFGYINVFDLKGTLIRRFVSNGVLNSPWAINYMSCKILVGNMGDGTVNVFDNNGNLKGTLFTKCGRFTVDGLNSLVNSKYGLFFSAGIQNRNGGIIGKIKM